MDGSASEVGFDGRSHFTLDVLVALLGGVLPLEALGARGFQVELALLEFLEDAFADEGALELHHGLANVAVSDFDRNGHMIRGSGSEVKTKTTYF